MATCTPTTIGNTAVTCRTGKGYDITILFSAATTRPEIADAATVKLEATWDALIKGASESRVFPIKFSEFAINENEEQFYDGPINSVHLNTKAGKDEFMIYDPSDWDKFNLLLDSNTVERSMYIATVTNKNNIGGLWASDRIKFEFEYVKVTKTLKKKTVDAPEMLVISIESLEPSRWTDSATIPASFSAVSLEGLLDVSLDLTSATTTVITVVATDTSTGLVPITDLLTADFLVKDASGSALSITAAHTGLGTYTLTGTFTTSTTCTSTLNTPAIMDKLYEAYNILDCPIP